MSRSLAVAALAVFIFVQPLFAQPVRQKEELVDQVKNSIDRGVNYLRRQQSARGDWERGGIVNFNNMLTGGQTCLAMLALLNCGVKKDDPVIQNGLAVVRSLPQNGTYVVGLQTMVLAEFNDPRDKGQIQNNVNWLLQPLGNPNFTGWSYQQGFHMHGGDFSNTQYALLGLQAGRQAGAHIDDKAWQIIKELYKQAQNADGSFGYALTDRRGRLTMTTAGIGSLYIAGMELKQGRQGLDLATGVAKRCGEYDEDANIRRAFDWLRQPRNFGFEQGNIYYSAYGIERAGRFSGHRFIADRDWYREGCQFLVNKQQPGGEWSGGMQDGGTVGATAFALLFLSKGRTPTLISKLSWGNDDTEWNRKHNDMRYVVEYCSKELFKKTPLAWQVYDCRKADQNRVVQEAAELLQSPIVFLNGHDAPKLTGVQKEILKKYVQEGGFVLAEACCGSKEFAQGFRDLMKELFEKDMVPVAADHALYRAWAPMGPKDAERFPLERLDLGCKTVVVLATRPLAGYWEENLSGSGMGTLAFRLAGNIVAYATNMELPKPKLTEVKIVDEKVDINITRNFLEVGQLRHEGDWEPAPAAMRNLMSYLRATYRLDVSLKKADVRMGHPEIFQHRFLYMHGRGKFTTDENMLKNLRMHLKTGGLLLADACCGSKEFDASFREMANKLFPEAKLEPVPEEDFLYSADFNGTKIDRVKCRRPRDGSDKLELLDVKPSLEGIRLGGRWVVIYSKYDLGCALEKHPSADCIGHDHESALKLAGAAVLYYLRN
jgi:hypothetical protein